MGWQALPRDINFQKLGALAAFLLLAAVVAAYFNSPSGHDATKETRQYVADIVANREQFIASAWLGALSGLLILPVFGGLQAALRRWSVDYMRVALLFGVLSGVFFAASSVIQAIVATEVSRYPPVCDFDCTAFFENASALLTLRDALATVALLALGIALVATSIVMLWSRERWWVALAWIGLGGAVSSTVAAVARAPGMSLAIPDVVPGLLILGWVLGVGVGLLRLDDNGEGT